MSNVAMPPSPVPDHSIEKSLPLEDGMDDAAAFAVPDVDISTAGPDEASPFITKGFGGKDLASQDFELGDIDCAWLDKLTQDSQLDDLPSGILDNLVPEEPVPPTGQRHGSQHGRPLAPQQAQQQRQAPLPVPQQQQLPRQQQQQQDQQQPVLQPHLQRHMSVAKPERPASIDASRPAVQRDGSVPMHMPVPEVMYVPQMQQMQWMPYTQYAAYPGQMHAYASMPMHMGPHMHAQSGARMAHEYAQHAPMHMVRPSNDVQAPQSHTPSPQPHPQHWVRAPDLSPPHQQQPQQQQQQHIMLGQATFVRPDPSADAVIDIEAYVPRSLLPMSAAARSAMLQSRHVKLERFREKKRKRSLKKTIRYASRKAYAEVRPRIKGRFARKDEVAAMRANGTLPVV